MSEYRNMTRLACFVAGRYVAEYDREMIGELVLKFGKEAVEDFYEIYGRIYGRKFVVDQILNWISEMED